MTPLRGTGLVADDLYLMAHDDVTGRQRLQCRALGLGLAGGLLAEVMLVGNATIWSGTVVAVNRTPPADVLGHTVLDCVLAESERHPVGTWLAFLARTATEEVARRLERSGVLRHERSRRPWRGDLWVPADMNVAFAPLARVRGLLAQSRPIGVADATLAGLAVAAGLGPSVLWGTAPEARQYLDHTVAHLDAHLRELIAQTQAAVDSALLSHRV